MQQCIKELKENKPTEIGFDLECYNKSRNYQITCLIQLATNDGREYIIDVLGDNGKVWDTVGGLANIFADKSIVKIGHGINGLDIQSIQRDLLYLD
jgi:ribonuclease D